MPPAIRDRPPCSRFRVLIISYIKINADIIWYRIFYCGHTRVFFTLALDESFDVPGIRWYHLFFFLRIFIHLVYRYRIEIDCDISNIQYSIFDIRYSISDIHLYEGKNTKKECHTYTASSCKTHRIIDVKKSLHNTNTQQPTPVTWLKQVNWFIYLHVFLTFHVSFCRSKVVPGMYLVSRIYIVVAWYTLCPIIVITNSIITGDHSLLIGPTVNTKNLHIRLFLLTIVGPIYYGPPW